MLALGNSVSFTIGFSQQINQSIEDLDVSPTTVEASFECCLFVEVSRFFFNPIWNNGFCCNSTAQFPTADPIQSQTPTVEVLNYFQNTSFDLCKFRPYLEPVSPFQQDDPYGFEKLVTVERLFNARCHLGHKV